METKWTDALLDTMRQTDDPPADAVIEAVVAAEGGEGLAKALHSLVQHDEIVPGELPQAVRDYFAQTESLPAWADRAKIERGEAVFVEHGPVIGSILVSASLPFCYACAKGVNVLFISTQLSKFPERRIIETARFLFDVMTPGGLAEGSRGVRGAQKIRLLHATMRHVMLASGQWDPEWGHPLNQEDKAITLLTFSTAVLDSLDRLNIHLRPEDEAAYLHAWNVVGHLLGIRPELLPADAADGRAGFAAIRRRQFGPSEAGKAVTQALVQFVQRIVPGTIFDGYVPTKMRYLIGSEVADMLDVPKADWTRTLLPPIRLLMGLNEHFQHQSMALNTLANLFGRSLLMGMEQAERGGSRPMFHVPEALREQWNLPRLTT